MAEEAKTKSRIVKSRPKTTRPSYDPCNLLVIIMSLVLSVVMGVISQDLLLGGTILFASLVSSYLASLGRKSQYIVSIINYFLMGLVAFDNALFGSAIFYILICIPLQIWGYVIWGRNQYKSGVVKTRKFTIKTSIFVIVSCVAGSVIFGYLLSLIPGQQLSFLDAASNCINFCGIIMIALRYAEAWWIWLVNNVLDFAVWLIIILNGTGTRNAPMMFVSSIAYLVINIYGAIKWWQKNRTRRH